MERFTSHVLVLRANKNDDKLEKYLGKFSPYVEQINVCIANVSDHDGSGGYSARRDNSLRYESKLRCESKLNRVRVLLKSRPSPVRSRDNFCVTLRNWATAITRQVRGLQHALDISAPR